MRTVAIIQARMGSTRLPGKVLMDIGGETVLSRVVKRVGRASLVDEVVVATTDIPSDEAIVAECDKLSVNVFRGSEHDVLNRYLCAAKQFRADAIVRITSDCPLIDPVVVDQVVGEFCANEADFGFNDVPNTFPRGLDVEVFTLRALQKADQLATEEYQREHVTPVMYAHPDIIKTVIVRGGGNFARYRWTLDTPEDLQLIRSVYGHFLGQDNFRWQEIAELMERSPHLVAINSHVVQKQLEENAVSFENALPAAPSQR